MVLPLDVAANLTDAALARAAELHHQDGAAWLHDALSRSTGGAQQDLLVLRQQHAGPRRSSMYSAGLAVLLLTACALLHRTVWHRLEFSRVQASRSNK